MVIYTVHRMYGLLKIKPEDLNERYLVINQIKSFFPWLLALMSIIAGVTFLSLPLETMFDLIWPCFISLLYVVPLFNKKRLRDYPFIKIIAIAFSWSYLTLIVPLGLAMPSGAWLLFLERFCFFLAITLPFDLRDKEIDQSAGTLTFASVLNAQQVKSVSIFLLSLGLTILFFGPMLFSLKTSFMIALTISYLITGYLIILLSTQKEDAYYTFLLDGTIGLRCILILISMLIVNLT